MVQMADLVVKELLHGEPVQGLVRTPADVRVVDVRADYHTDPVPAAPATETNKYTYSVHVHAHVRIHVYGYRHN